MRILFVNEKCGYFGGVEQSVADTAVGLRERGHECHLTYGDATGRDAYAYRGQFDGRYMCGELATTGNEIYSLRFSEVLREVDPHVIYLHRVPSLAMFEPLFDQWRIIRMVHDHGLCCPRQHKYFTLSGRVCHYRAGWRCYKDMAFLEPADKSLLGVRFVSIRAKLAEMRRHHRLDALFVGSRFMRDELLSNGFREDKVHILPPVVRMHHPVPIPVPEDPRILYVGQLVRGKGVDLLLRALTKLSVDFSVTLVGDGDAAMPLKAQCQELGLSDRVRFKGWVDHEDLSTYYSSAKLLVVPSRWPEPFGMIGLEAMHHGRPVVGFDVGGIPDWLEDGVTGLLAPEQDIKALAEAIERLLTDTDLAAELGRNAYRRVGERFGFDDYLDTIERHFSGDAARLGGMPSGGANVLGTRQKPNLG